MNKSEIINAVKQNNTFELDQKSSKDDMLAVGAMMAKLYSENEIDSLSYFESIDWVNLDSIPQYQNQHFLIGMVEIIDAPTSRLYAFFHKLIKHFPKSRSHILRESFTTWAATHPSQLEDFSTHVFSADFDSPFVATLIFYWHKLDIEHAFKATLKFAYDPRPTIKKDSTSALKFFKNLPKNEFGKLEKCLETQISSDSEDVVCSAIDAIQTQISYKVYNSPVLMSSLVSVTSTPTPYIHSALIENFGKLRMLYTEELRTQIIYLMKTVQSGSKEALDRTNRELSKLDLNADRGLILEVLTAILTQDNDAPRLEDLGLITNSIASSSASTLGWYISRWLIDGNYTICKQLSSLFSTSGSKLYKFDIGGFNLTERQIHYFSRKIFVYLFHHREVAVSLLCECLVNVSLKARKVLENSIAAFWLRNFRGDLSLFEKFTALKPSRKLRNSINRLKILHDAYLEPLKNSPMNHALQPSAHERNVQIELNQKESQDIIDEVKRKSLFFSSLQNSTVLYGRSCVNYTYRDDIEEPIPMRNTIQLGEFKKVATLPSMLCLCPTHLDDLLNIFSQERFPK